MTAQAPQLRLASALALLSILIILPLQVLSVPPADRGALLLVHGLHTAVAAGVLAASFTRFGGRHADGLSVVFVFGMIGNLLLYLYLLPFAVPTYPSLMSNALTAILIAGAVLFSWSTARMAVAGIVTCVGFAAVALALCAQGHPPAPFVGTLCWLVIGAILAVACARVLGRFRARLLERQEELTALSTRLISVQEEQLRQLSRELHDELGQSLTAVSSYLWLLEQKLPREMGELRARAAEARHLVAKTLGEMRELSQLLRPPGLDLYGLGPSLEAQLRAFAARHHVATKLTAEGLPERLPEQVETAVYRIIQEALTNVARHAHAHRVSVALTGGQDELRLEVADDGVGLPPPNGSGRPAGIGLVGIRERVRALGGTVSIASRAAGGVRLSARVPLNGAHVEDTVQDLG
ncbi:MAG TPA: sensor histidine kinase [Candidatus Binatia bacterium]|nr:sensor histidine kinase [Candidatus Binatia bacterium]